MFDSGEIDIWLNMLLIEMLVEWVCILMSEYLSIDEYYSVFFEIERAWTCDAAVLEFYEVQICYRIERCENGVLLSWFLVQIDVLVGEFL